MLVQPSFKRDLKKLANLRGGSLSQPALLLDPGMHLHGPESEAGKMVVLASHIRQQCWKGLETMSYGHFRGASSTNGGICVRGDCNVGSTGPVLGVA